MNIIDKLDTYLLSGEDRERTSHHPSDITSCLRQMWYKWNNVPKSNPPTAGNIIKMRFGGLAETFIEDLLKHEVEQGTIHEFEKQVEVTGIHDELEFPIHGYEDFVVETKKDIEFGIECKSSFGRGVKEVQLYGPKEEHLLQVFQYMYYAGRGLYYLVYLARDNGYRTQFEITRNDKGLLVNGKQYEVDWPEYIERLKLIEEQRKGEAPECEYKAVIKDGEIKDKVQRNNKAYSSDWQCRYCPWKDLCHKEELDYSRDYGTILYGGEQI